MKSVGIDIGSYSIKVAEVEASSKGHSLIRFEEFPLNIDPAKDTQIDIIEHLRSIASRYDAATTHFVVGINQNAVSSRYLTFPFKDRYKILKTLPFELEDEVPFQLSQAIFDAKISRLVGDSAEVIAVTSPKHHVATLLNQMNDGHIDPYSISPKGIALANVFEPWRESPLQEDAPPKDLPAQPPAQAQVFLDIGHRTTTVLIVRNGCLIQIRTITWGGHNLAQAISLKYELHYVEATKELCSNAFILNTDEGATQDQVVFSNLMKTEIDCLGKKLRLILLEAKTEHRLDFTEMGLLGGTSQVKNLGLYLTQLIEVPTNRITSIVMHPELDLDGSHKNEISLMVSLGLALDGIKKRKHPGINLRQGEFERQSKFFLNLKKKWGYSLKIAGATFLFFLVYTVLSDSISEDLNTLAYDELRSQAKKVANLKGRAASPRKIKSYIKSKNLAAKNSALASKLNEINSTMDILRKITRLTPKGSKIAIDVMQLSIQNDQVLLKASVMGRTQMELLKTSLMGMSTNNKIEVKNAKLDRRSKKQNFTFQFRVNRKSREL